MSVANALAVSNLVQGSDENGPPKTKKGGHEPITNKGAWTKKVRLGRTSCLSKPAHFLEFSALVLEPECQS